MRGFRKRKRIAATLRRCGYGPGVFLLALAASISPVQAACPVDPPPEPCDNNGDFIGGRWDISARSGSYSLLGTEFFYWNGGDDVLLGEDYFTSGTLTVEILGGADENYLDVACDGTVSGQGRERISGTIDKVFAPAIWCIGLLKDDMDMHWNVEVERSYSISGTVTGFGQLELDLTVDEATLSVNGTFFGHIDSICDVQPLSIQDVDVAGDVEKIQLSGGYDPDNTRYEPFIKVLDPRSWLEDVFHRLAMNFQWPFIGAAMSASPELQPPGLGQPIIQSDNQFFLQDAVPVNDDLEMAADTSVPVILSMVLQEPAQYLLDVAIDTGVEVTIDWRGESPGTVEFTYGGTTETVPGADTVTWTFNAGEPGTSIQAVAKGAETDSQPFTITTPKVAVPGWAGGAGSWSGAAGIQYDALLDWPVTLETTRTLDTVSLFTGLWGISGSVSSEFNATALSSGAPGANEMTTQASFKFAGKSADLRLAGPNQTTLSCENLTTEGSATAILPLLSWKKTINPLTLIPGLEPAVCGFSGFLCGAINSIGVKAEANASLAGTPTYSGQDAAIEWDGGSLGGTLGGSIGLTVGLPKPISKVASFSVQGGASGCMDFTVAPDLALTTLGGELNASASASIFGFTVDASEEWPFGDACPFRVLAAESTLPGGSAGWVPPDGQLSMAAQLQDGDLQGIAVWSELPTGSARPAGNIHYRFFSRGQWGPIRMLTDSLASSTAPAVAFDSLGHALVVYMHSDAALPTQPADLPAFADSMELRWARIDPKSELPGTGGELTANAVNDFGPDLVRDAAGGLHLFWQQANGIEFSGTSGAPVTILHSAWNATSGAWQSTETVAADLVSTFGWSAAAQSADAMLVGLVIDTDQDLATADDREIYGIVRTDSGWAAPSRLTDNGLVDDSVVAGFDDQGQPVLLWRRAAEVLELRGDLQGDPAPAFTTPDPSLDDGVGQQFAQAALAARGDGMSLIWPDGTALLGTGRTDGGPWDTPTTALGSGALETIQFLAWIDGRRVVGYATRPLGPDGAPAPDALEAFFDITGNTATVFRNGFEAP